MRRSRTKAARFGITALLVGGVLLAAASPAGAVTIGRLAPGTNPPTECTNSPFDIVNPTVSSGPSYAVPSYGAAIVAWSTNASAGAGQQLELKVFRPVAADTFQQVGHDGPRGLTPSTVNTFSGLNIPVKPGDLIGLNDGNAVDVENACAFAGGPDNLLQSSGNLNDGQVGEFGDPVPDYVNVTAVVKPTNTFTFGSVTRNKKQGTAFINVNVPAPGGTLELTGKGLKSASSSGAHASTIQVSGPATVQLKIKSKGKTRKRLNASGKAKVTANVTYTPTDGDPNSVQQKVKLKKRI